jgi:hypothetical protein
MNLNKKNLSTLILILVFSTIIGCLFWELLERILSMLNINFTLTLKEPLKLFDIYVISLSFRANPGILLGLIGGCILFKRI